MGEKIRKYLLKELNYDGDADKVCPHCHKVIEKGRQWLYHWESMSHGLAREMGFDPDGKIGQMITDFFHHEAAGTGSARIDSKALAGELIQYLGL